MLLAIDFFFKHNSLKHPSKLLRSLEVKEKKVFHNFPCKINFMIVRQGFVDRNTSMVTNGNTNAVGLHHH